MYEQDLKNSNDPVEKQNLEVSNGGRKGAIGGLILLQVYG